MSLEAGRADQLPICRYCGEFIEVQDQACAALDDGGCQP